MTEELKLSRIVCEFRHNFLAEKSGKCPKERISCQTKIIPLCEEDHNCDEHFKCCTFACKKKCMDPYEGNGFQTEVSGAI